MNYCIIMPKCQILTDNGQQLGCARRASIGAFQKLLVNVSRGAHLRRQANQRSGTAAASAASALIGERGA